MTHEIAEMRRGKGRMHHGGSSHSGSFICPTCQRVRWINLNWIGHGGSIYCNGRVTQVMWPAWKDEFRTPESLFKPTKKQAEAAAKAARHEAQYERSGARCTPGHEDHCMDAEKDSPCDCGCGGANHGANAPAKPASRD